MRVRSPSVLMVLSLVGILLLAGCTQNDGVLEAGPSEDSDQEYQGGNETRPDDEKVYRLYTNLEIWGHSNLAVLVVPPAHGQADPSQVHPHDSIYLRAVEDSITHWQEVIDEHGSKDLQGNLTFSVYVLGRDILSPDELDDVDILITHPPGGRLEAAGQKSLLGGFASPQYIYGMGPKCVIGNLVHPLLEYNWLFMVSAHEFGHCLGMGHPEDFEPWDDLMSYTERYKPPDEELPRLECVSNMNLMAVESAFAHLFGRKGDSTIEVTESEYEHFECADRFLPDG